MITKKMFLTFFVMLFFTISFSCGQNKNLAGRTYSTVVYPFSFAQNTQLKELFEKNMVAIPNQNFLMLKTEVTQGMYIAVMDENPSHFKGDDDLPVEYVSWYDAIYFCNVLSEKLGLTPVYAVDGETDVSSWRYIPHKEEELEGEITQSEVADGFRLPTNDEWEYAAKGGQNYTFAGSDNIGKVGWYLDNSEEKTHFVAEKMPNGYGVYDMSGNVEEWVWDFFSSRTRYRRGGSVWHYRDECKINYIDDFHFFAISRFPNLGFRVVRSK